MTMEETIIKKRMAAGLTLAEASWEGFEYVRAWKAGEVSPEEIMGATGWTREELKRRTGK